MIDSRMFADRTDHIVLVLRSDPDLGQELDAEVVVYKGFPRRTADAFSVWVWRSSTDEAQYTLGGQQVRATGTWGVTCVTRYGARPEELEDRVAILAANVFRCLATHKLESGYWHTATPVSSDAIVERDMDNQQWEYETIEYEVHWEDGVPDA